MLAELLDAQVVVAPLPSATPAQVVVGIADQVDGARLLDRRLQVQRVVGAKLSGSPCAL